MNDIIKKEIMKDSESDFSSTDSQKDIVNLCETIKKNIIVFDRLSIMVNDTLSFYKKKLNVLGKFSSALGQREINRDLVHQNQLLQRATDYTIQFRNVVSNVKGTFEDVRLTIGTVKSAIDDVRGSVRNLRGTISDINGLLGDASRLWNRIKDSKAIVLIKTGAIKVKLMLKKTLLFSIKMLKKLTIPFVLMYKGIIKTIKGIKKMILATMKIKKIVKLGIGKVALVAFGKILIPILAIVAAVKLLMRAARFLGRIFGRGGSGQNYEVSYIPSASYKGISSNQMIMQSVTPTSMASPKNSIDYIRMQQSVREGTYEGMVKALRKNQNFNNQQIIVKIDGEDVRARIEGRERNVGARTYRGLSINGRH